MTDSSGSQVAPKGSLSDPPLDVAEAAKSLVTIPEGKVVDFVDGALRNNTPEEYVRQNIERSLVFEYRYPREEIAVELRIKVGSSSKRVDLAIFGEDDPHKQEAAVVLVETKKPGTQPGAKTDGVEQLKSYMAACLNARFGIWTNGDDRYVFEKVGTPETGFSFDEVIDIPIKGMSPDEADRPSRGRLKPAVGDNLLFALKRCHNYIAGNEGLQKPEAFWELLKIIFCKIEDERSEELNFYVSGRERASASGQAKAKRRISQIFERQVRAKYPSIFKSVDEIEMKAAVVAFVVSQLQGYSLLDSHVDVKGVAYEEIVGANLRGDRGEFFTPRNAVRMAVRMMDPKPDEQIIDPACGTGGFLVIAMNHVFEAIDDQEKRKWRDPDQPTRTETRELDRRRYDFMQRQIFGLDLNPNLVRAAKMNMVMNNDGSGGLYQANSLDTPLRWSAEVSREVSLGSFDAVFTNPPFGTKIRIDDPLILEQYDLAAAWDLSHEDGRFHKRVKRDGTAVLQGALPPEILFIERCWQLLKPESGRMAIVLPNGILNNPALAYVRQWIVDHAQVLAVVDMHRELFSPRNDTQTSVLFLRRKSETEIERDLARPRNYPVFMAVADKVGHDKRGNPIYRRHPDGSDLVEMRREIVMEVVGDEEVPRQVETPVPIVDDQTPEIANLYTKWLRKRSR
jgi:type I restriction enzyme M protein